MSAIQRDFIGILVLYLSGDDWKIMDMGVSHYG